MPAEYRLSRVRTPGLEFGGAGFFSDPKEGLAKAGPFDLRFGAAHRQDIRIALVGTADAIQTSIAWFSRCQNPISPPVSELGQNSREFPGFENVFRTRLTVSADMSVRLSELEVEKALAASPAPRFHKLVDLYSDAIREAKREFRCDLVVCCLPQRIWEPCWSVTRNLTLADRKAIRQVLERRSSNQMELPLDWQPEESEEDLLTHDFRRALKARAMQHDVPIQLLRDHGSIDQRDNEPPATRAWNFSVALYYKSGGIPWRMRSTGPETCFVGITFHHLRTTHRALVYSSLAQAFSTNGEGFALKGSILTPNAGQRREVHLEEPQASALAEKVIAEYVRRNGAPPKRIVFHKSSRYNDAEAAGFAAATKQIPVVELVTLAPTSVRLLSHAAYPPVRGTVVTVNDARHFLFTSGYLPEIETYPGPHIPAPIEIIHKSQVFDLTQTATEILALGRLNWNTASLQSSQPVTLGFARRVGGIMAEYGLERDDDPDPSYRFYM